MAVDLVIKNGTIVSSMASYRGHLLVKDGKVLDVMVRDDLPDAKDTIDATGLYVLPGSIDPHVHFRAPGLEYKEDWNTGSQAAVAGGITTIIDNPNVVPPTSNPDALKLRVDAAKGKAYCDYGILAVIMEGNLSNIIP